VDKQIDRKTNRCDWMPHPCRRLCRRG